MVTTLIVTEKPDAALHVAEALDKKGKPEKLNVNGVPFFQVHDGDSTILVCSALGHLYAVDEKAGAGRRHYPVWDFAWKPKYLVERGQQRQEKWLKTIAGVSKEADIFVNGCDYDIEGSLIGYMILRYACGGADRRAKRMKFSTLTAKELRDAYENLLPELDYPLVSAGMCRHEVDWLYGVNLSRALTESAYKYGKRYATLSTGRVQGPTMRFVVEREKEIGSFVPLPYWTIRAIVEVGGNRVEAEYEIEKIEVKREAERVVEECRGKAGRIEDIESKQYRLAPPTPFDLSTLQAESYRHFGIAPRQSLGIAERLYLDALVSYPRTSSQKLPPTVGYRDILEGLAQNPVYEASAKALLAQGSLRPSEGKKTDPAHPAIYPTGSRPARKLDPREQKIYDLIVKRFMATFGEMAKKQSEKATIRVGEFPFYLRGSRILEKGWIAFYDPYAQFEEITLPPMERGEAALFRDVSALDKYTQPPPRFNPSSLLRMMEENGIGTKATRAEIVETLYKRGYIKGERIVATQLAFKVNDLLLRYCPRVIDIAFTHELEEMMENIEFGKENRERVVFEAVEHLRPIVDDLKARELEIGRELTETIKEMKRADIALSVPCPDCGSELFVLRSRKSGKRFIGCSGKWKGGCGFTLPLLQFGALTLLDKRCDQCGFQIVQVRVKGRRPMVSCPQCFARKMRATSVQGSGQGVKASFS